MARMKFLCDADRCIECNACVTACKNEHEVPWGINRRRVVTINDGKPGERSISMACMHCTDAPCAAVCPTSCFYTTADAVVLHDKGAHGGTGGSARRGRPCGLRAPLRPTLCVPHRLAMRRRQVCNHVGWLAGNSCVGLQQTGECAAGHTARWLMSGGCDACAGVCSNNTTD